MPSPVPRSPRAFDWRSPVVFLMIATAGMQLGWATWWTLLNNFAVEAVHATGREIGIQQSVREIPGLLAVTVLIFLLFLREQTMMLASLVVFGAGVAVTGFFPSFAGFLATTIIMSFGFHYYDAIAQSLALQWLDKRTSAVSMGRIVAAGAVAQIIVFGTIFLVYRLIEVRYEIAFLIAGGCTLAVTLFLAMAFPRFPQAVAQRRHVVLRARYWLYYCLTFLNGARRQIFAVFALFMLVERFGFAVHEVALLFLVNCLVNVFFPPWLGSLIVRFGERRALMTESLGLIGVFLGYAFVGDPMLAATLYCIDSFFFTFDIAHRTYLQKIADPADMAPTAGAAMTINHIAAVVLPAVLGLVWLWSPAAVFFIGAGICACALVLAMLVPAEPAPGRETLLSPAPVAAE